MKKLFFVITIVIASLSLFSNIWAQYTTEEKPSVHNAYQEISNKYLSDDFTKSQMNLTDVDSSKMKSPLIGGALSLVIPGAGQFYAKSYIKTGIFVAIEAGLWVAYAVFQKKGDDQVTFFQNYADANWSIHRYARWLKDQNFTGSQNITNPDNPNLVELRNQVNLCEQASQFSHTLPYFGDQQYYEVIGKYQTYIAGWSTAEGKGITKNNYITFHLDQVAYYMGERQQANTYYDRGTTALTVVILNHIASAIDGFLTVKSHNNKLSASANVSFAPVYSYKKNDIIVSPFLNVKINF